MLNINEVNFEIVFVKKIYQFSHSYCIEALLRVIEEGLSDMTSLF